MNNPYSYGVAEKVFEKLAIVNIGDFIAWNNNTLFAVRENSQG